MHHPCNQKKGIEFWRKTPSRHGLQLYRGRIPSSMLHKLVQSHAFLSYEKGVMNARVSSWVLPWRVERARPEASQGPKEPTEQSCMRGADWGWGLELQMHLLHGCLPRPHILDTPWSPIVENLSLSTNSQKKGVALHMIFLLLLRSCKLFQMVFGSFIFNLTSQEDPIA